MELSLEYKQSNEKNRNLDSLRCVTYDVFHKVLDVIYVVGTLETSIRINLKSVLMSCESKF